jgi:hypothetical protein
MINSSAWKEVVVFVFKIIRYRSNFSEAKITTAESLKKNLKQSVAALKDVLWRRCKCILFFVILVFLWRQWAIKSVYCKRRESTGTSSFSPKVSQYF